MSRFIFVGDTVLNADTDGEQLTAQLLSEIGDYDFFCCNLEAPVAGNINEEDMGIKFSTNSIEQVKRAGINIVSLANNHIMDCGLGGMKKTLDKCMEQNVLVVGAALKCDEVYKPLIVTTKDNLRIAFFSAEHRYYGNAIKEDEIGVADIEDGRLVLEIINCRKNVDYIVLNAHCGLENTEFVLEHWRRKYHFFIDLGVDLIVGHHPHIVQEREIYKGKIIAYSLGNFAFDLSEKYKNIVEKTWYEGAVLVVDFNTKTYAVEFLEGCYREGQFLLGDKNIVETDATKIGNNKRFWFEEFFSYLDAIRNANKTFRPNYKVLHHYLSLDAQGLLIREVLENENRKYEFIPRIEENYEFDLLTKPYIVWGTGKTGRTIYQFLLEKGFKVIGFADGLIKDDNQIIFESVEIPVFSVRTLKKIESDFVIVIASNMKDEIFSTIKEEGIKKECIFYEQLYSFVAEEEIAAWKMMDWSYQEASDRYVNYRVLPKTKEESPVILYLHGAGSNGSDNRKQIAGMGELGQALVELRKELDFEVIVPQCPYSRYWMNGFNYSEGTFRCEDIKDVDLLNHIVDKLREKYVGNTLIIIGYSCGAYATWYLLMKYPKLFEKALIISGGADMSFDVGDVETKITLVHGKKDKIVPVCGSQNIYNVYKKYVDYYEYESLGHELTFDISNQEWKKIINNIVHG